MKLYPLKFNPVYSYRVWGGEKLKTVLNKNYTQDSIGESWEISDVDENETLLRDGDLKGYSLKMLIQEFKGAFVGNRIYKQFGNDFPLLIKFIDAKTPLSIQVHPSNELAKERHNSFGKNEMWYVMEVEKNAELIVGFNKTVSKEAYVSHLESTKLDELLNIEKVQKGDTFYIPTGRVHAIGAGVLLAEIQQTSNITYRIYDYDRVDSKTGEKRELHTEMALDAIDFNFYDAYKTSYETTVNKSNKLVHSPYFKTNIIHLSGTIEKDYSNLDSFVIYMCVEGSVELEIEKAFYSIKKGETILLPATLNQIKLATVNTPKIIEVYM